MYVRIGTKIINALFVLLLNASLGSVLTAQTVDELPLSPRLKLSRSGSNRVTEVRLIVFGKKSTKEVGR